jgi:hypothetical protein
MDEQLLNILQPETLANIVFDLEEAAEEWPLYPEEAPDAAAQQSLLTLRERLRQRGAAQAGDAEFANLLDEARDRRAGDYWLSVRNRQTRDNWFSDYD